MSQPHVVAHFAWFDRATGAWLAEWKGLLPPFETGETMTREERERARNTWQHHWSRHLGEPDVRVIEEISCDAWDACGAGEAVCVDVTHFGWPVGDHVWHHWDEKAQDVVWGNESVHAFIEVDMDTMRVVANQTSHRPIRDRIDKNRRMFDITGTPWAAFVGRIWGRFVWSGTRWTFEPLARWRWKWRRPIWSLRYNVRPPVSNATRRALMAAPVGLDFISAQVVREKVPA